MCLRRYYQTRKEGLIKEFMVQFKSIKLVGFKSFADKTEIPLSEGVTCIVGPNGCGKSNVADAIRWVLGEQSAKQMRGTNMMDVIFGGTEKRKKMSFCEVTLTFDNTNRIFDIDCDEVEMTRRLYRDGDSEYILNRQPSRMKILTGLLHGAGAAKEGYSIIGQGRIAQIMNSRPEERRSIFEEATGIVVFKDRKAEAERKLKASQDNLFVFAQLMQEAERQLAPLSKAAENAKKYDTLYSSLRHHEVNTYIYKYENSSGEREKINSKIEKTNKLIAELNERLENAHRESTECRDMIDNADGQLKSLNEERLNYTIGLERSTGESKLFKEKANAVKGKLASAQDDITYSTKRIGEIDADIRRYETYASRNNERIGKLKNECEKINADVDELNKEIANYEYLTGENRKKVLDAFKDLSDIKENIGSLAAKKELWYERLDEIEQEMSKIKTDRDAGKCEYDKLLERQSKLESFLGDEARLLEEAEKKVAEAAEKYDLIIKRIYDTQATIGSLNQNLTTYRALRDRFDGYIYSVKRLMGDAKNNPALSSRIKGLIADVVQCSPEYETAIETAFGGAMQNVITQTRDDAAYLINYLKNNRAGQVTFLPIEALRPRYESEHIKAASREKGAIGFAIDLVSFEKKYENVIHNLLGNTLICDDIDSAKVIAARYPRSFKIVTLDGDLIATSGSMTGGSRRENSANLLANERKLKEIEDEIDLKTSALSRYEERRDAVQTEKKRASEVLDELRAKLQNARVEVTAINEKQSALLTETANLESKYSVYAQTLNDLKKKLAELDDKYSDTAKGADTLSQQSSQTSNEIEDMNERYESLVAQRAKKTESANEKLREIASLETGVKSNEESVKRLKLDREQLISKVASLKQLVPTLQLTFDDFNDKAARASLSEEEQKVLDGLIAKISEIEEFKRGANEKLKKVDEVRLATYEDIEKAKEKLHSHDLALQKLDNDLEFMQQRILEEYNETYESCLKYKEEGYDISQSASAIANFKRQLTILGPINPNAVEQYEEESARYEKMCEERTDLEKAIEDLTGALGDIREEMLKIFNEGFNTINENFKTTFKELFGGGKAELQLDYTDCDDPLNAGVEIVACPPGKKLAKISLLSGGEQALTAIAILFAIIKMRPMPFCVLDEIEAALDEANVGRYAKYLKKFASDTQFIVITHRKPTMENADVLFGVTMEEKGVSKIVSVKLSEVEGRLGGDTLQ